MKRRFVFILLLVSNLVLAQKKLKTYNGTYSMGYTDGNAVYTYYEINDERIYDGLFTFNSKGSTYTFSSIGKYLDGKKNGIWTTKYSSSSYEGMPVTKSELRWSRVTEYSPFKETQETTVETYDRGLLQGTKTVTKIYNNSWASPSPGKSINSNVVKFNFVENNLQSIDGQRKRGAQTTYAIKGSCIKNYANGKWVVGIENLSYNYNYYCGLLFSYVIRDESSGQVIEKKTELSDTSGISLFIKKSVKCYELTYLDSNSLKLDARIEIVDSVNNVFKLYYLKPINFDLPGVSIYECKNVFGEFPSPKACKLVSFLIEIGRAHV